MLDRTKDKNGLKFLEMDVLDMREFENGTYDVVIDKGTLDSILCGEGSTECASKAVSEVHRVLKSTGVYIAVSYGQPV